MPFFTVVGALSDRIGRKKLMMAGCLLAVITYIPIYKAMERAAGNNVVTVHSVRNKVIGAIALTAMTTDASGTLVPAKEAPNPNIAMLVLLVFVQVLYVCLVYGPIAAYLIEAFPAKVRLYVGVAALSHWQRRFRRPAAADWTLVVRHNRKYLCGSLLPDDRGQHDFCSRKSAAARNLRPSHLG